MPAKMKELPQVVKKESMFVVAGSLQLSASSSERGNLSKSYYAKPKNK